MMKQIKIIGRLIMLTLYIIGTLIWFLFFGKFGIAVGISVMMGHIALWIIELLEDT